MATVISVENLGKKYIIGHQRQERYLTLRDTIAERFGEVGRRLLHPFLSSSGQPLIGLASTEEFWALKDVSLDVQEGDRVGIIGRNGAGKSTLLKLLSRITEPTTGRIRLKGRVASLLEVGTGFHPELTGRENIYLNGAVLGMSKLEVKNKFDEIVDFAGVEKFLDTPVKRYSSGMYVRLAFAIAAHLEPDILIVDEVLAVGDAEFQKKCLGKMEEAGNRGHTVLFVSHNMGAVQRLTNRCILLRNGVMTMDASTRDAVEEYSNDTAPGKTKSGSFKTEMEEILIESIEFDYENLNQGFNEELTFRFLVLLEKNIKELTIGIQIINSAGCRIGTAKSDIPEVERGKKEITLIMRNHYLPPGTYNVNVGMDVGKRGLFYKTDLLSFEISDEGINDPFLSSRRDRIGVFFPVAYRIGNISEANI